MNLTTEGWQRLRYRLTSTVPWVAVLGPDGSGKTSVIAELSAIWPAELGRVQRHHWRPHRLGARAGTTTVVSEPHASPPRSQVESVAKLALILLDWWIGAATELSRERARGDLVVFDRCFVDILVDPRRYRYGGPLWLARVVAKLVPQPSLVVILDAPVEVLHARKREVAAAEVERQRNEYRALARRMPRSIVLDARQSARVSARRIVEHLLPMRQPSRRA